MKEKMLSTGNHFYYVLWTAFQFSGSGNPWVLCCQELRPLNTKIESHLREPFTARHENAIWGKM